MSKTIRPEVAEKIAFHCSFASVTEANQASIAGYSIDTTDFTDVEMSAFLAADEEWLANH